MYQINVTDDGLRTKSEEIYATACYQGVLGELLVVSNILIIFIDMSVSGRNHRLQNIPDLFSKECWKSKVKPDIHVSNRDLTDQLSDLGINDQHAKYPGM